MDWEDPTGSLTKWNSIAGVIFLNSKAMSSSPQPGEAATPIAESLSEFLAFTQLPQEIQDAIWDLSLPEPRIIPIRAERGHIRVPGRHGRRNFAHVWVPKKMPVPVLLHACRDSRRLALKHYELAFDSNPRPAKEDLPDLHNLPPMRGGRDLVFPFKKKAMVYVDLERDIFVTNHRRRGHRAPRGGWPKDDPRFKTWPVVAREFKIETFRECVPREIYFRIRTFAADYIYTIREIFEVMFGRGMASSRHILVITDAFQPGANGKDYIDELCLSKRMLGPEKKGKLRSLRNLPELAKVVKEGTLWDWAVSEEHDSGRVNRW